MVQAVTKSCSMQIPANSQFGAGVAAPDTSHVLAASFRFKFVHCSFRSQYQMVPQAAEELYQSVVFA